MVLIGIHHSLAASDDAAMTGINKAFRIVCFCGKKVQKKKPLPQAASWSEAALLDALRLLSTLFSSLQSFQLLSTRISSSQLQLYSSRPICRDRRAGAHR